MTAYTSIARQHIANLENALAADRELEAEQAAGDATTPEPDKSPQTRDDRRAMLSRGRFAASLLLISGESGDRTNRGLD